MANHRSSEKEGYRRGIVDGHDSSGLTVRAYCRQQKVSEPSFTSGGKSFGRLWATAATQRPLSIAIENRRKRPRIAGSFQCRLLPEDNTRYKNRNQVERFFNRIKQCRRVATRYEKTIQNFASLVWLAALIVDMI